MKISSALVCAVLSLALPGLAGAQSTDDDDAEEAPAKKKGKGKKRKAEKEAAAPAEAPAADPAVTEEPPIPAYDESGEPAGASENPDDPNTAWTAKPVAVAAKAAPVRTGYPIERIYRPLVLPRGMIEVAFDAPMSVDPGAASGLVRGSYSITDELQVGLRYGTGTMTSDKYFTGKAFQIDVEYLIQPWISAQVGLPLMIDPYAQGVTLGAPIKFAYLGRFSIEILRDLVSFKVNRFVPSVFNAAFNEGQVALDRTNTALPDGQLDLGITGIYQFSPAVAGDARWAYHLVDFETEGAPVELSAGLTYSTSNKLDVGARLGFFDLGHAGDTFMAQLGVAYRL